MANQESIGSMEDEALKRKERLKALKRKHDEIGKEGDNKSEDDISGALGSLPRPKFRSYRPQDDNLRENVLPDAQPGDVEAEVKEQLRSANTKVVIEELTFDILMDRRDDAERKLRQPRVLEVENKFRSDLCILRSMVGREYCSLLLGAGNLHRFHHMANKQHTSSGERDTRLFELLYRLSVRVVWIALRRHYGNLIEEELNRLFRSDAFNLMSGRRHHSRSAALATPHENSILHSVLEEKAKLLVHSPVCSELTKEQEYRMLGIGYVDFKTEDPRVNFYKVLYDCPEEELVKNGVTIGILGLPRVDFDAMLIENPKSATHDSESGVTSKSSYLRSQLIIKNETVKQQLFKIPVMGEEEPVPVNFPRNNISSPDLHFEQREDARMMWKLKSHPSV